MSLLLDALKKAAKDKEASSAAAESAPVPDDVSDKTNPTLQSEPPELTLDDIADSQVSSEPTDKEVEPPSAPEQPLTFDAEPSPNRVSDEALQVLIYKTNHAHRKRRLVIWGGAAIISVITLTISGLYFFKQIQQGIDTLETRHRVNMRAVESEPVKVKNLKLAADASFMAGDKKSDTAPSIKPPAKSVTGKAPTQSKAATKNRGHIASGTVHKQRPTNNISVVRGVKKDPVGTLLSKAWAAYNASDYAQANNLYAQVLSREKNNRDAIMGLAAIALKKNDARTAMHYYGKLLELDPRDPVANAAIINMNSSLNDDTQSEARLLYLLRLEPNAAHLYYALGNKYAAQSKWPESEAAYFNAYQHDSTSADYAYNLAVSLERIGQPKEAIKYYKAALQLAQNSNISFSIDVVKKRLEQIQQ
jgi:tetratricopeptide (TPR) repeat protein